MTITVEIEMPGCTLMTGNAAEAMEVLLGAEVRRAPPLIFVCLSVLFLQPITGSFANTYTRPKIRRLPSVCYELFLLALLVRKAIQFYRASNGSLLNCTSKNPVARVLIRDSVTYFVMSAYPSPPIHYFTNILLFCLHKNLTYVSTLHYSADAITHTSASPFLACHLVTSYLHTYILV